MSWWAKTTHQLWLASAQNHNCQQRSRRPAYAMFSVLHCGDGAPCAFNLHLDKRTFAAVGKYLNVDGRKREIELSQNIFLLPIQPGLSLSCTSSLLHHSGPVALGIYVLQSSIQKQLNNPIWINMIFFSSITITVLNKILRYIRSTPLFFLVQNHTVRRGSIARDICIG